MDPKDEDYPAQNKLDEQNMFYMFISTIER